MTEAGINQLIKIAKLAHKLVHHQHSLHWIPDCEDKDCELWYEADYFLNSPDYKGV
jgi:hypothetical protein